MPTAPTIRDWLSPAAPAGYFCNKKGPCLTASFIIEVFISSEKKSLEIFLSLVAFFTVHEIILAGKVIKR